MHSTLVPMSFHDVDEFSAWEVGLGWDIESTQLTAGANEIGFDHVAFPGLVVAHFHARQSMQNLFTLPAGMVVFPIVRSPRPLFWCGEEVAPTSVGIAHEGHDHWVVLPPRWDSYEFLVSVEMLRKTEVFPPSILDRALRSTRPSLPLGAVATRKLLRTLDRLFAETRAANGVPLSADRMLDHHERLLRGLGQVVEEGLEACGSPVPRPTRRPELVWQAREYFAAHPTETLSIEGTAADLGVSYRVLNYAFQDALGVSPYQYHLTERLHAARRLLRSGDASVTEACLRHGFSTPSRFARQYRRLFGELPSATLAHGNGSARTG